MYSTAAETATSYTHTHDRLRIGLWTRWPTASWSSAASYDSRPPAVAAGYSACTPLRRRRPPVTLTYTTSCGLLCVYSTAAETATSYTHTYHQLRVNLHVLHCGGDGRQLHSHTTSCGLICTYSTEAETATSYTHTHHQLRATLHVLHCAGDGRQLHSHIPPAAGYSARTPLRQRRSPVTFTHTHTHHQLWVTLHVLHCGGDGRQLHSHTPPAAGYSARTPLRRRRPPVTLTHTTSCGLICTYSTAAETAASYTHTHHQLRVTLHVLHCGGDGHQLHSHTPPAAG